MAAAVSTDGVSPTVVATLKLNSWTLRKGGCYGKIHKDKSSA